MAQHGPAWKCIYPKNKPTKNARNHGKFNEENFWTTQKSYKLQEKIAWPFVFEKNVGKSLISVEDLKQS